MHRPDPERPLRVALLSPCFWPEVRRGTERFARELADGLLARGHRPSLITSHPGPPRRTTEAGLPVLRLPRPPQGPLVRRGYESYLTHVPLSYLALRLGSFDVAHALYPTDAVAAARWSARTGRPSLLSYMGIPNGWWLDAHKLRRRALCRAIDGCDAVVALSRHAADAFAASMGYRAKVIAPGVDLRAFAPAPARAGQPTIVCSAALEEPRKNVPLLVSAFRRVRERHPDSRLVLSRPRGGAMPAELGTPGVELADLDSREALARAYAEAWTAVLPSVNEAFGLVVIEALACGTPAVGFADAAIPELLDRPGIGRLFDRLDPDSLADALLETLELARDPATAARCRARAEQFGIDRCTESYLTLYRELLA